MPDNYLLTEQAVQDLSDMKERLDTATLFSGGARPQEELTRSSPAIRGYLMQGLSRGQSALCALVTRQPEYKSFKIDLAGVIYTNHPDGDSKFKLRFKKWDANAQAWAGWFDTESLSVEDLKIGDVLAEISSASINPISGARAISSHTMLGILGHPAESTSMVVNDEIYPTLSPRYRLGDQIESKTGCWIFSVHRSVSDVDFDVDLLFSVSPDAPVNLNGPAVMTIQEIADTPNYRFETVFDAMDVASPTPLRAGSKIAAVHFEDIGYGVISANVREYLFEQLY